ncbi:MAG: DNA-binding response regulator [Clostridia bacterium]|jgi:two-component system response regulator YesN|nr:DNA-binding response regulator [Clostridia bacterium]
MIRLLIADDEDDIREGMRDCIDWKSRGITVSTASDGPSTYNMIIAEKPDIVLIDIHMPGMSGLQVIDRVRKETKLSVSFIILSGYGDFAYAQKAIGLSVDDYLLKPCSPGDVLSAVEISIKRIESTRKLSVTALEDDFFTFYSRFLKRSEKLEEINHVNYPKESEHKLMYLLQLGTKEDVKKETENFLRLVQIKNSSITTIINCCVILYMEIYRMLMERGLEYNFNSLTTVSWNGNDVLESLKTSMHNTVLVAFDRINTGREANTPILKAVNYINENYNKELSLDIVAQAVFVSPAYLSGLFKQVLDVNFIDYIHKVRIDKAKTLLTSTDWKNYEISAQIGYACEKYFSQVFKKYTSLTPSQFREQMSGTIK